MGWICECASKQGLVRIQPKYARRLFQLKAKVKLFRRAAELFRRTGDSRGHLLPPGDERPRLHDIDLPLHVSPFDILVATPKDALDSRRCTDQTTYHFVSKNNSVACNRHFFHTTTLIE